MKTEAVCLQSKTCPFSKNVLAAAGRFKMSWKKETNYLNVEHHIYIAVAFAQPLGVTVTGIWGL